MQIDEGGIFKEIIGWIAAGVAGLVGFAVKSTNTRISRLEHETLSRSEFREYVEKAEQSRSELRDSVVKLFDKIDSIKDVLISRNTDG